MCDPGLDGDMWDNRTASGKPYGTQPYIFNGEIRYPTEGDRLQKVNCKACQQLDQKENDVNII